MRGSTVLVSSSVLQGKALKFVSYLDSGREILEKLDSEYANVQLITSDLMDNLNKLSPPISKQEVMAYFEQVYSIVGELKRLHQMEVVENLVVLQLLMKKLPQDIKVRYIEKTEGKENDDIKTQFKTMLEFFQQELQKLKKLEKLRRDTTDIKTKPKIYKALLANYD